MGGVQILHGVFSMQLGLASEILIKGADGGHLAGPGGRGQAVMGVRAVGMDGPVPGQIVHIGIDIAEGDGADQFQIHVINGDLVQRCIVGHAAFVQLEEAEKISQIQKIFVYCAAGVTLNGLMVDKKIPQNWRCVGTVIHIEW